MNLWSLLVMVYGKYHMGLIPRKVDFVVWNNKGADQADIYVILYQFSLHDEAVFKSRKF